jgi:hypothetical protein
VEDPADLDALVHHFLVAGLVRDGSAPTAGEIAAMMSLPLDSIAESLRRLSDGHGLVLHPGTIDVWMVHPFSLSPTATWVDAGGRGWWAPCIWCATGIAALAAPDATIHSRLGGEAEAIAIRLGERADPEVVVHFPIPPREAWNNVVHYCATVLPFRRESEIDAWCARHRIPRGAAVPIGQVQVLGRVWYGRHMDRSWRKWTVAQARSIFEQVGLTDRFWHLPDEPGRF